MKLTILTFSFALFIFTNVEAELGEKCYVKDRYYGECMYLHDCPYYDDMIKNYTSLGLQPDEVFDIFREIHCGFVVKDALICCPPSFVIENQDSTTVQSNLVSQEPINSKPVTQPTNPAMSTVPNNPPVTTIQAPVIPIRPSPLWTTTSTTSAPIGSTPYSGFTNFPATRPYENGKDTTTQGTDNEKYIVLLPKECGRVLTYKYFYGNRTEFDDFPWATLIEYDTPIGKQFACGGSLIHSRYVLTAAHCVTGLPLSWKISRVRFGEYDTDTEVDCIPDGINVTICNSQPLDVAVEKVIVHSEFKPSDLSRLHDIALLRLSVPVNFTDTIKPICLPTKNPFPQKYYTSGWGKDLIKDSIRIGTNLKYMSYVSLTDRISCQSKYTERGVKISQSQICGGEMPSEKPCIGDAGGPLMGLEEIANLEKRVTAFGVLSVNKPAIGECKSGNPSVYTKILDYMNWILENLK